eukprot:gnl/MRDRNA2_/MRDRNA2_260856_c0_seq1.p1 gnl/MRDRNA2_/MRDRNA2_260856_c0~~gnl/MRDRNA2_/MRDRNA2_260856_c0_seq1.p1  ORF type:complete len:430 (+),score=38.65 gnl/MRDRNA2_/MRDRNA2_260856_c0_seq1:37-1290(+)
MAAVCLDALLDYSAGNMMYGHVELEFTYRNLECLDELAVLSMILHKYRGCASLLKHPVLWRFIIAKWRGACRGVYIKRFVLYTVFAMFTTVILILIAENKDRNNFRFAEEGSRGWAYVGFLCVIFMWNLGHIWSIFVKIFCSGTEVRQVYTTSVWNLPDICHLLLAVILAGALAQLQSNKFVGGTVQASAMTTFLMWLKLLKYLRVFRSTGVITISFMLMLREVCNFLLLYFCLWCAFSFSLFLLLQSGSGPTFEYQEAQLDEASVLGSGKLWQCFAFLFFLMVSADFEVKQILEAGFVTTILFMAFSLTMCLMAANLLIALLTTIYQNVADNADMEWRLSMARAITELGVHKVDYDAFQKERISGVGRQSLLTTMYSHTLRSPMVSASKLELSDNSSSSLSVISPGKSKPSLTGTP